MEEQYFKLVQQAQSAVDRGEVLPCAESIAAYLEGFPLPDPAFGQVWWTAWSGQPIPVFVGQVGFTNRGPQVAVRMEPNSFLVFAAASISWLAVCLCANPARVRPLETPSPVF